MKGKKEPEMKGGEPEERPLEFIIVAIRESEYPATIEMSLRRMVSEEDKRHEEVAAMLQAVRDANPVSSSGSVTMEMPDAPATVVEIEKKKSRMQQEFKEVMEAVTELVADVLKNLPSPKEHHHHLEPPLQVLVRKEKYLRLRYMVGDVVTVVLSPPIPQPLATLKFPSGGIR